MKITDIKVHLVDMGREFYLPMYGSYKAEVGIVRVFTDEGIEGNADYSASGYPAKLLGELIVSMKPYIIGEDPFDIERIWERTFKTTHLVIPIYASGCINVALWDIVGKALNLPIYRLLGGFRERIRAYASTQTCEDMESFVKLAESLVERGFTEVEQGFDEEVAMEQAARCLRCGSTMPCVVFKPVDPQIQVIPWDPIRALELWQKRQPNEGEPLPNIFAELFDVTEAPVEIVGHNKLVLKAKNSEELLYYTTDNE